MNNPSRKKPVRRSPRRCQYEPLTEQDIRQIHDTSMRVLSEVGIEVLAPEAFEIFKRSGAAVDSDTRTVRFRESQVMEGLASVPSPLTLCGRRPEFDIRLGDGHVYYGTGGTALHVLDIETKRRRRATLEDLIDIIRLVEHLDNIHLMLLPTYPNDLPVKDVDINRFFSGLCFTRKHIMGGIYTEKGIRDVIAMAERAAGGADALRKRPLISMIACGISPLRLDKKYGHFMIELARRGIPTALPVEPLSGATAPASLAGTLVIQNCDGLVHILLAQLARPGAPVIYGSVATSVNFQNVSYLGGPVESGMLNAATAQLARHYGLPFYSTAGISDSKTLDAQCGYETAINNLLVALACGDFIHDAAGLMEFALTVSLEKLVIDNDILGMVDRAVRGIEVNSDTLAFETIRNAGPGGNFISERHTRRHMNREHYFPSLTDRSSRETWRKRGRPTSADQAREVVRSILSEPRRFFMEPDRRKRLLDQFPRIRAKYFKGA